VSRRRRPAPEAVDAHYKNFVFPHVLTPESGININVADGFERAGGDRELMLQELTFLTLPAFGGGKPELHGSKPGEYNLKFVVGVQALKILLQRKRSALGPLFKAAIERSREELLKSSQFVERCLELEIDPDDASLNVVYQKVNVYLKSGAGELGAPISGTALHRDKLEFWARVLASLVFDGEAGGPVAELYFALLGYDGSSRLYGRWSMPRDDLDLMILLSGCQRYGEACVSHGVQQLAAKKTHLKSLANAVVDFEPSLDPADSHDHIGQEDVRSEVRSP
jgi:hypothetical protein